MDDRVAYPYRAEEGVDRGRGAESPREVPPRGWKDVLVRVMRQVKSDNVPLLAAGVAFFALLALVPSLVALVSVYGLVAEPADIQRNIEDALAAAPTEVALGALVVLPATLDSGGSEGTARTALLIVRWPLFAIVGLAALAVLYRWAPDRQRARWRWVSPGAIFAVIGFVNDSAGFSIYTAKFGNYNETYGALGAIVVVMLWLFISAYVVIVGAELNAELERQTAVDSTTGPSRPLGERAAYAADTVGPSTAKR